MCLFQCRTDLPSVKSTFISSKEMASDLVCASGCEERGGKIQNIQN
jgi:hypothetical protein